jgi:hypothetical protein
MTGRTGREEGKGIVPSKGMTSWCLGGPVLFEEQPVVLIVVVIALVEGWIRVREPLFQLLARVGRKTKA